MFSSCLAKDVVAWLGIAREGPINGDFDQL